MSAYRKSFASRRTWYLSAKIILVIAPVIFFVLLSWPLPEEVHSVPLDFQVLSGKKGEKHIWCLEPKGMDALNADHGIALSDLKKKVSFLKIFTDNFLKAPPELVSYQFCITAKQEAPDFVDQSLVTVQTLQGKHIQPGGCVPYEPENDEAITFSASLYVCGDYKPEKILKTAEGSTQIEVYAWPTHWILLPLVAFLGMSGLWWGWLLLAKNVWRMLKGERSSGQDTLALCDRWISQDPPHRHGKD